ncbi:MAG: hypothetical protein KA218_02845 [Arenimonas sp.]|nr:hypothetical protein [Arenimonas sp.]MBP7981526.1 hypothetical protein [Arenimonas sp.]
MTKTFIIALLTAALFAALSLISGAPYLNAKLFGHLPVGNALTAIGLCAAAAAAIGLSARGTPLRRVCIAAFLTAVAWLPLSIALAGNLELNLSGSRGEIWMLISLGTLALVAITLLWALARAGFGALTRRRAVN